jgi:hypothetical protein
MAARPRSWAWALEIGRRGERVLDAVFGPEFLVVEATPAHQRQSIDRFLIRRRDGREVHRVDYKCDVQAGWTGNLALEHVSVLRAGRREALGWLHTTIADLVVFYVPAHDAAYLLEVPALREAWGDILRASPPKRAATAGPRPYVSLNCCVPIQWLRVAGLIQRVVEAVGGQLRLPWTDPRTSIPNP